MMAPVATGCEDHVAAAMHGAAAVLLRLCGHCDRSSSRVSPWSVRRLSLANSEGAVSDAVAEVSGPRAVEGMARDSAEEKRNYLHRTVHGRRESNTL